MNHFTDIHSHFVYGMDDGARTQEDMEAMIDASWADGVSKMIATPHVTPGIYPFYEERLQSHLSKAREYCRMRGYDMTLYPGAEILYNPAMERYAREHSLMTLAGTDYVLMEFIPMVSYKEIEKAVRMLEDHGYTPILAHIERYPALNWLRMCQLKKKTSVLYQMNCSTVLDCKGLLRKQILRKWIQDGLIDFIATDSHNLGSRKTCMREAYEKLTALCGEDKVKSLVEMME